MWTNVDLKYKILLLFIIFSVSVMYISHNDSRLLTEAKGEVTKRWSCGQYQNVIDRSRNTMVAKAYTIRYEPILRDMVASDDLDIDFAIKDPRITYGNVYQFTGVITSINEPKENEEKVADFDRYKTVDVTVLVDNEHYIVCTAKSRKRLIFFFPMGDVGDMVTITGFVVGKGSFANGEKYLVMVGISEKL